MFTTFSFKNTISNRYRNVNRRKRAWLNKTQQLGLKMDITRSLCDKRSQPTHVLIQLSTIQWRRFSSNSIHVLGRHVIGKHTHYESIDYGCNIKFNRRHTKVYDENIRWNRIDLRRTKQSIVYVTTSYDELESEVMSGSVLVVDGCARCAWNDQDDDKYHPSNVLLLAMIMLGTNKRSATLQWGEKQHTILRRTKNNINTKVNNHHKSVGQYYSFGNRANYGMVSGSSITQYITKKTANKIIWKR